MKWIDARIRKIVGEELATLAAEQERSRAEAAVISEAQLSLIKSNARAQAEKLFGGSLPPELNEFIDGMLGSL